MDDLALMRAGSRVSQEMEDAMMKEMLEKKQDKEQAAS